MSNNAPGITKKTTSYYIDPKVITPRDGWNPRFSFGEVEELAKSIKANGLIFPLHVKRVGAGFELIDGDRRLTAIEMLLEQGHEFPEGVPAQIKDKNTSDLENLILMFESNSGKPFLPLEAAAAYKRMRDAGMTLKQISERVGRKPANITDTLRLLTTDVDVQDALKKGKINTTAAMAIAKTDKTKQKDLVEKVAATGKGKGKRATLLKELDKVRVNRRASTPKKAVALDVASLKKIEADLTEALVVMAKGAGIEMREIKKQASATPTSKIIATYAMLIGIQTALGHEVDLGV